MARNIEHWKIKGAGNGSDEYKTDNADRIQKLQSRSTNIPSFEGPNDSTTDRSGQRKQFSNTGFTKCKYNLPPPLLPNPSPHHHHHHNQVHQVEINNPGQVTNSEILKSIQSITEVMQQQLLLNSKTNKQGIVQTASLFQEMIKAQEKRELNPALLVISTF